MADQTVYFGSSVSGDATNPTNAVGSTQGNWSGGPLNSATSWTHTWSIQNPTESQLRAELQLLTMWFRKGSNSGNPTVVISVTRGGTEIVNSGSRTITSTTGQGIQVSWTPTAGDSSQGVEVTITCTAAGGNPGARNSAEIDYLTWLAKTQAAVTLTPVTKTLDLRWNIRAAVASQLSVAWNVKSAVNSTLDLRWNVLADAPLTPVTKTLDLLWNVKAPVASSLGLAWNVRSGVSKTLDLLWNVQAGGGGSFDPVVRSSSATGMTDVATINVPVPAGTTTDDVVLVFCSVYQSVNPPGITGGNGTWEAPLHLGTVSGDQRDFLFIKRVAAGGEPANYVLDTEINTTANHWTQAIAVTVSGIDPNASIASLIEDFDYASGTGTAFPAVSVTLADTNPIIFWYSDIYNAGQQATPPTGYTELQDGGSSGGMLSLAYRKPGSSGTFSTSGGTGSHASSDSHGAALVGIKSGSGGGGGLTPVTKTLDLRWNVKAGVVSNKSLLWNVKAGVASNKSLLWNVRAGVASQLDLRWNIKAAVNSSLALRWNVIGGVGSQLGLAWNVRAGVLSQKTLLWNVKQSVNSSLTLQWGVKAGVESSRTILWNVISPFVGVGSSLSLLWNVRGGVQANRSLLWNVRAGVSSQRTLQWNVKAAVNSVKTIQWNVRSGVTDTLDLRWNVRAGVPDTLDLRWNVRAGVPSALNLAWNVRSGVQSSLDIRWNVMTEFTGLPIYKRVGNTWVLQTFNYERVGGAWV